MFDCFQELFAYYSQINAFQKRELGDKYKLEIIKAYQEYRRMIERKEHTPAVEWMLFRFPEIK
jgi:hypothetical protein